MLPSGGLLGFERFQHLCSHQPTQEADADIGEFGIYLVLPILLLAAIF